VGKLLRASSNDSPIAQLYESVKTLSDEVIEAQRADTNASDMRCPNRSRNREKAGLGPDVTLINRVL
jgi:hypothetical protein